MTCRPVGRSGNRPWGNPAPCFREGRFPTLKPVAVMTEEKSNDENVSRAPWAKAVMNLDVGFWVFMAAAVVTCGWAPNCAEHSDADPVGGERAQEQIEGEVTP